VLVLLILSTLNIAFAQKVWGVDVEKEEKKKARQDTGSFGSSSFEELQRKAELMNQGRGSGMGLEGLGALDSLKNMDLSSLAEFMSGGTDFLAELMQMPEVQEMLQNPDALKEQLLKTPLFANNPALMDYLDTDEMKDPEKLKETVNKGLKALEEFGSEFQKLASNPELMASALEEAMKNLDSDSIKQLTELITNPEKAASDLGLMFDDLKNTLTDPGKMMEVRDTIMNDPELSSSPFFNTPEMKELLEDPEKFSEYVQKALGGAQDWLEEAEVKA